MLVDEVGRALLVVLDRLLPAERVAFVLRDMFAVPFDEIAPAVGRSGQSPRSWPAGARLRLRGAPALNAPDLARHRRVVEAFLAASRAGDVDAILSVLDPDVRRADRVVVHVGQPLEVRGAGGVAQEIAAFGRNARFADLALVNGSIGIVVAPSGRLRLVIAAELVETPSSAMSSSQIRPSCWRLS